MFNGRIDRIGYLLGSLYVFVPLLAVIVLYAIINFILNAAGVSEGGGGVFHSMINIVLYLFGIVSMVLLIPASIGIQVRRWHDIGQTGWLTLLSFVPFVGWITFFILLFAPGKNDGNTYGAPASPRGLVPVLLGKRKKTDQTPPADPPQNPGSNAFGAGKM